MNKKFFLLTLSIFAIFVFFGCTKLDTTSLGSDLVPIVDNINTFADTLSINASQGIFDDSTKVRRTENHVLGFISNDPLFGKTTANIYLQLKPAFYPYHFGNSGDSINVPGTGLDSVVLCLAYKGAWGDSSVPQQIEVRELSDNNFRDSINILRSVKYQPQSLSAPIGSATVDIRNFKNKVVFANKKDSTQNQLRIKITNSAFLTALFNRDTTTNTAKNAFRNDSLFRRFYNGLAITAGGMGNTLMYFNLTDPNTRLEIHYRKKNTSGAIDTVYSSFRLSHQLTDIPLSSTANSIVRNYAGTPVLSPGNDALYLQTAPGTYANLNIPGLTGMPNRIIHRAQITIEQIPGNPFTDSAFSPPPYMYLDLKDTGAANKWKPIYFDLNPSISYDPDNRNAFFPIGGIDLDYFGGIARKKRDNFGNTITYYDFNITRYVQQIVTRQSANYPIRIFPAYNFSYPQYSENLISFFNPIAFGRIKVGSGSHPTRKMKLIIIYSKLP